MKRTSIWAVIVSSLVLAARAEPTASSTSIIRQSKPEIHWFAPAPPKNQDENLRPIEGLSPRAWTTTVGWHPGASAFPDEFHYSSRLDLMWVGHEPWRTGPHSVDER